MFATYKKKMRTAIWLSAAVTCTETHAEAQLSDRLVTLPLEQLMQYQVESVSKYSQKIAEAPASVSIVTAQDIQTYGYKTLADILGSMRGLYVSSDRNYSYLGVRGFSVPGDLNTRVLILVDGVHYNDNVFDQAPIDTDFGVDVDLIDRVEFISGPASAVYGSNALLGVINVITKTGADFRGANVAVRAGSYGTTVGRATLGDSTAAGGSWLLSATRSNQQGQDLYYTEFDTPAQNHGRAEDSDYDRATQLLAKFQQGGFVATLTHVDRTKGIPTASFEQTFNDDRAQTVDTRTNLGVQYQHALTRDLGITARVYSGHYVYTGNYVYDDSQRENRDKSYGDWVGGELQSTFTGFAHQKIVLGTEYRYAPRIDQENFDVAPRALLLDDRRSGNAAGFYLQDELALSERFSLNLGDRVDRLASGEWVNSPRAGLIYQPQAETSLKLLYGSAYRTPNAFEQFYYPQYYLAAGADSAASSSLERERIQSKELVLEHALNASQRLTVALFRNDINDLITLRENPSDGVLFYTNEVEAHTEGAEVEWQGAWRSGVRVKTSYSWQQARDENDATLVNSPHSVFKFNLSGELWGPLHYGVAMRAVSARDTLQASVPGYGVMDITLRAELTDHIEMAASLYNVFDHSYSDPGSAEHVQDALLQNERSVLFRIDYWL